MPNKEPTKEWKVLIRDWWYRYQDAGYELPETGRVELEHIIQEAVSARESELIEKASRLIVSPEYCSCEGDCKRCDSSFNSGVKKVIALIKE